MEITKLEHSCIYVVRDGRAALFDPGIMSAQAVISADISQLDDIIITHGHIDHFDPKTIEDLISKFPKVQITAPKTVVDQLANQGFKASSNPSSDITTFVAPHESVVPLFPGSSPDQLGVTYQGILSHPGDSHSFKLSRPPIVLALPVTAPWGTTVRSLQLALELKPKFVLPIHDWHWRDEARAQMYEALRAGLKGSGITFLKPVTGQTLTIDI